MNSSESVMDLRRRYLLLFGNEPTESSIVDEVEATLQVTFPNDFKEISSFYNGGILGGISHHSIASTGPANNVVEETIRFRQAVSLPNSMVVLAEPPASLIVLDTDAFNRPGMVIWCDSIDVSRLNNLNSLRSPQTWPTYCDFFRFLLDREEEERQEE